MSAAMALGTTIESVTSEGQAEQLREAWRDLWDRASSRTIFQRPEWLLSWWRHLGHGEFQILCCRRNGRLVGLLPLTIQQDESGTQTVQLLGTGVTDYLDALADPEVESDVCAAFFDYLQEEGAPWETCDFQQLRPGSLLLTRFSHEGWRDEVTVQEVCPTLKLPTALGDLRGTVPANMLQKLGYYRRRAERAGGFNIEPANRGTFAECFAAFVELHGARWTSRQQPGVLSSPEVRQFMWDACEGLLEAGHLRLYAFRLAGKIAGTLLVFHESQRASYYLSGFEPSMAAFSPGTLLIGHAIEQAVAEGASEFDFLRGRETYKYMWGAKGRLNYRRRLVRQPVRPARAEASGVGALLLD